MPTQSLALAAVLAFGTPFFGLPNGPEAAASPVREFTVDDAWGRDTVQFRTTAPIEDIVGTTNQITGYLRADPADLGGSGTAARLEVDLKSIKTGIDMRDGHVAKALGADKNPVAVFTLKRVRSLSAKSIQAGVPVDLTAKGAIELNGVRREQTVSAKLTYIPRGGPASQMRPGNFVKLSAEFDLRLADFDIERRGPVLPLQVGDTARVVVTALASDATPEEAQVYRSSAVKYLGKPRK